MLWETSYLIWGPEWCDWCATTQWRWRTSRTRGARDRTLWCRWPYGCSSGATARWLRWFPSICQECTTSRRIPCPESARHWPRSGRWPWRVYNPCLPSGANHRSTCLRHSPTDDSSSLYRRIRTPGRSGQMPCPCPGTRRGAFCMPSRHSRWSLKYCRRSLSHQEWRWFWSLNCNRQHHGSQSWWTYPKKIRSRCSSKVKTRWRRTFGWETGWPRLVSSDSQIYMRGNSPSHPESEGSFQGSCRHDVKVPTESSQQVYESHWSRFVAFCRTKRWHVFRVRSHHFSTYMMHLFRDGLYPRP